MNMRHNEILKNSKGDFVFSSQTNIGRYSQWFDHSDVRFSYVYKKTQFQFQPHKIIFLVPLFQKDLFLVRSENQQGVYSDQFIYCSFPELFKIQKLRAWLFSFLIQAISHSVTLWSFLMLKLSRQDFVSVPSLVIPVCFYFISYRHSRSYLIRKMILSELTIWILLLSSFYCLQP
jgi:hypothetical protein